MKIKLKKEFGQNFLNNETYCEKIVSYLNIKHDSFIIEIGPGSGALTKYITNYEYKTLHVIEFDAKWANYLLNNYKKNKIKIFNEDILDYKLNNSIKEHLIIGNIPYYITHPILDRVIEWRENIDTVVLMIQEEVAKKICKKSGKDYGYLSVVLQLFFDIELLDFISAENFIPIPKVNSRIIRMRCKKNNIMTNNELIKFKKFLYIIFRYPRKKIRNNIIGSYLENNNEIKDILDKRAQEISPLDIYNSWKKTLTKIN